MSRFLLPPPATRGILVGLSWPMIGMIPEVHSIILHTEIFKTLYLTIRKSVHIGLKGFGRINVCVTDKCH